MFTKIAHLPKLSKFLDLSETGSCPAPKGGVRLSEVGLRPTSLNLTPPLMAPAYRNWFVDLCINRFVGAKYFYLTKPKIEIPLLTEIAHWLKLLNIRFCGFQMSKTFKPFIRLGWNFFRIPNLGLFSNFYFMHAYLF